MRFVVAAVLLGTRRIMEWRRSRKEKRPGGSRFLGRSVLGAVDSSEGGMSSGTAGRCSHEKALLWRTLLFVFGSFWWGGTRVLILV